MNSQSSSSKIMDTSARNGRKKMGYLEISHRKHAIYEGINTIGRDEEGTVIIRDLTVSHQHAVIVVVDKDRHFIADMKSNGTELEGNSLRSFELYHIEDGCQIKFASHTTATYTKIIDEDMSMRTTASQNTQVDASFYAAPTQIIEDSLEDSHCDVKDQARTDAAFVEDQSVLLQEGQAINLEDEDQSSNDMDRQSQLQTSSDNDSESFVNADWSLNSDDFTTPIRPIPSTQSNMSNLDSRYFSAREELFEDEGGITDPPPLGFAAPSTSHGPTQELLSSDEEKDLKKSGKLKAVGRVRRSLVEKVVAETSIPERPRREREPKSSADSSKGKRTVDESQLSMSERKKKNIKPKIAFIMPDSPELCQIIQRLGGFVVDTVDDCTVLVTKNVLKSHELLIAIARCIPICSPDWLYACKKANEFLDPWEHIIEDKNAEERWNFSLALSYERSRQAKLFQGYRFRLIGNCATNRYKVPIESAGGKCVSRAIGSKFLIIASEENKKECSKFRNYKIALPEAVLDSILRQELVFDQHLLVL